MVPHGDPIHGAKSGGVEDERGSPYDAMLGLDGRGLDDGAAEVACEQLQPTVGAERR